MGLFRSFGGGGSGFFGLIWECLRQTKGICFPFNFLESKVIQCIDSEQ